MKQALTLIVASCVLLIAATGQAFAADATAGQAKSATCIACHGVNGISPTEIYPNLAGQKQSYMVKQMKAFKNGSRKDPTMSAMVTALTEQDLQDIAAYYSQMK